jgi:hypothetical protein
MPQLRLAMVLSGVFVVLGLVYWLKVWHAQGICAELGGVWEQAGLVGECRFIDKNGTRPASILDSLLRNS